jgi:hypothetical protein
MTFKRFGSLTTAAMILALVLAACGGGAGGDPVATVQAMFNAVAAKQFDRLAEFACADKKDEIESQFNIGEALAGSAPGLEAQQVLDAMTFSFADLKLTETNRSGNAATVHAEGKMVITVDPARFRVLVKALLEAQGLTGVDDAMIDQFAGPFAEQFEQGQDITTDFDMVNEGGKWLICGP